MAATKRNFPLKPPRRYSTQQHPTNKLLYTTPTHPLQKHHKCLFTPIQPRGIRFIPSSTVIPLTHISTSECNPPRDIATNTTTIQIQNALTHIYEDTSRFFMIIPTSKIKWLWKQYNIAIHNNNGLVPPT